MVTSRPSASVCLHQLIDSRIEVLGFEKSSKEQYVNDALKSSPEKIQTLKKHFQQYPNIDAMCYIPLNMEIIVYLCLQGSLPPTSTEIFASFILHTVCHHLKRKKNNSDGKHIKKIEQLPQPVQQALQQLQKVAFDGLVEDKIVFTMDDLPNMCRDDPTYYGLLQSVEHYCSNGIGPPIKSFNFLHLGIQEYFAAKYVATLPEDKVYALLEESFLIPNNKSVKSSFKRAKNHAKSIRLSNMWIMYCGITSGQRNFLRSYLSLDGKEFINEDYDKTKQNNWKQNNILEQNKTIVFGIDNSNVSHDLNTSAHHPLSHLYDSLQASSFGNSSVTPPTEMTEPSQQGSESDQEISSILSVSEDILKDPVEVLYLFQCFREAQDVMLCGILSDSFDSDEIDFRYKQLLPPQVVSLGFFLSKSHRRWKKLNIDACHIGDHGINLLQHYICGDKTNNLEIKNISLVYNDLTVASSSLISDIVSHLKPHTVILDNNFVSVKGISTALISTNTVKLLSMWSNCLTAQEASAISDMMTCLEELYISSNKLGDNGAKTISKGIANTNSLRILYISNNNITSTGATAIAKSLLRNTSLEALGICENKIGQDGTTAIAQAITNNKTLKQLSLHNDDTIDDKSSMIIMRSLHCNNSITKLWLPIIQKDDDNVKREVEHINSTRAKCDIKQLEVNYD